MSRGRYRTGLVVGVVPAPINAESPTSGRLLQTASGGGRSDFRECRERYPDGSFVGVARNLFMVKNIAPAALLLAVGPNDTVCGTNWGTSSNPSVLAVCGHLLQTTLRVWFVP